MGQDDVTAKLTERQLQCLRLVADLKKTEQIAAELGISPSTVNTHIERAVSLLGAPNRREAARMVAASSPTLPPEKSPTENLRLAVQAHRSEPDDRSAAIGRRRNDLTWEQRIGLATLALVMLCIGLAGLGAAIEQLSHWSASMSALRR